MSDVTMETLESQQTSCTTCQHVAAKAKESEEMSMAFLLALLPVITLTFFGQVGLL